MQPIQPVDNTILEGSFLGSKYLNPAYLFDQGYAFFQNLFNFSFGVSGEAKNLYYFVLFLFGTFFLFLIAYCAIRLLEIRKKEKLHLQHEIAEYRERQAERETSDRVNASGSSNPRWVQALTYLFSSSPGDWKLAIIEADAMLDGLMDQLGFKGETLGEKLKKADQGNFRHLTTAWEVHTIRNKIAHEGMAFEISQHEAKRVIALYEKIFHQYGYI